MKKINKRKLKNQNQYSIGGGILGNIGSVASGVLQATQDGTGNKIAGISNAVGSAVSAIPGFGTIAGGVIKGVGNLVGGIFGANEARKAQLKAEAKAAVEKQQEALAQNTQINNSAGNKIYPDSLGTNIYAKGGKLETVNPNEDLVVINTGGTHEQNPLGGVPVGTDENGTMNTVEEGETILKDFVYSNRIKVPDDIDLKSEYNLPNALKGKTFADASKIINNKFKEREDKVSLETKQVFLDRLASLQEELKQAEQDAAMIANGINPDIAKQALIDTQNEETIDSIGEQQIVQQEANMMPQNQFPQGGIMNAIGYNNNFSMNNTIPSPRYKRNPATSITEIEKGGPSGIEDELKIKTPTIVDRIMEIFTRPSYMDENGNIDWSKISFNDRKKITGLNSDLKDEYNEYSAKKRGRQLESAAALNAIAGNLTKLSMNKPPKRSDYSAPLLPQMGTLSPRLTNKARLFNAIDRSARSAEYSLRNLVGSNPGALMANLGSLRARQLNAKADTALQVEDRDNQIKMAIDQYNNQAALRNALQNQQVIANNQSNYMNAKRDYEDTKASIIGGLFGNLGQVIQGGLNRNFVEQMTPIYGRYSMLQGMSPNVKQNKKGGKIKRK